MGPALRFQQDNDDSSIDQINQIGDLKGPLPYLVQEPQTKQKQIAQQSTSGKEQFLPGVCGQGCVFDP